LKATEAPGNAARLVVLAGICAALHVGKLAPAIAALQAALGMSLLQAGFLLSLVQGAGMSLGLALGAWADTMGPRRSMLIGLGALGLASIAGATAPDVATLMALRVVEGFGFLLVVLPAPGLLRALVAPDRISKVLGLWGTYMPTATAAALLCGPPLIAAWGWRPWWGLLGLLTLAMAVLLARQVSADAAMADNRRGGGDWLQRARQTLTARGPWLVALVFAAYSSQWIAVVGFLPVLYAKAGFSAAATGVLTALVAAVNIVGNVAAGRALHRGVPAQRLLVLGFLTMALSALIAYAEGPAPVALRYAAVLALSAVGGLIPGTLFSLALRVAPHERCVASTVGWMQQWSAGGQFVGPPAVAWVAAQMGGWQWTWVVTGTAALLGVALSLTLARLLKSGPRAQGGR
jgi:MFS family permease